MGNILFALSEMLNFAFSLIGAVIIIVLAIAGIYFITPANTPNIPWAGIFWLSIGVMLLGLHFWTKYDKKSTVEKQADRWFEEQARLDQIKFQKWREERDKSS